MKHFDWPFAALFLGFLSISPASAGPSPWYKWQSVTGEIVCAQTSPGAAWIRLDKTYVDPRCQRQDKAADESKPSRK